MAGFALLALGACSPDIETPFEVEVQFAKGGGPSVDAADPPEAPPDITMDVRVIGSGFDEGSAVKFLLGGQSAPKIVTNSSTFVDRNNVIANITIEADAELALYDIEITTGRGKKGIGSELFRVKEDAAAKYELSLFPNPDASIGDVSDANLLVGQEAGRAALFDLAGAATPLPDPGGSESWASHVSPSGLFVTGAYWDAQGIERDVVWDLRGGTPTLAQLDLPAGMESSVDWVNDGGLVAGQLRDGPNSLQWAAVWEPNGLGAWTPRLLGELPGHAQSYARGVNNAGHVAGRSIESGISTGHAVLWTPNPDGTVDILDLTPDYDGTGDTAAWWVTDPAPDGTIEVFGYETIAGDLGAMVWTVDPTTRTIVDETRNGDLGRPSAVGGQGQVLSGGSVWNPDDDTTHGLAQPGPSCSIFPGTFDNAGRVLGRAEFGTRKNTTGCGVQARHSEQKAVIWTPPQG